mmetsp:Transcript_43552/g.79293  ORF Transcript_43552/g.79293 Transcript_43552/m.79293 type:complete len:424 (-) Transcript_43552:44-1315(-)
MKQSAIVAVLVALGGQLAGSISVITTDKQHGHMVDRHAAHSHRISHVSSLRTAKAASKVERHVSMMQQPGAPAPAPMVVMSPAGAPGAGAPLGLSPAAAPGSKMEVLPPAVAVPFKGGNPKCPCIGFDNIDGDTLVDFDGKQVAYPADLGARCEAWDNGKHPTACLDGQEPGPGNGWCAQPWCYVDACKCDLPELPKVSSYLPEASYIGKPLYFSYSTCGGKDTWSETMPKVGLAQCRCIGFAGQEGSTQVQVEGSFVDYPAEMGGTCQAWDKGHHPSCKVEAGKEPPSWCGRSWCYVDPCSCNIEVLPKVSLYLPDSTFQGKPIYYSYTTCGEKDEWTEENHKEACVNQKKEEDCTAISKCTWDGKQCFGKELADMCGVKAEEPDVLLPGNKETVKAHGSHCAPRSIALGGIVALLVQAARA